MTLTLRGNVVLSTGRVIAHSRLPNGAQQATPTTGDYAMTPAEYAEYEKAFAAPAHLLRLVEFIRSHHVIAHADQNGTIRALDEFTTKDGAHGSQWVTLPAELGAVRDWLGY